ncbi:MAG TPA: hypothetical protein VF234_07175, partial [Limnochordia bacterium]
HAVYAVESAMTAKVWYDAVVPKAQQVNALINPAIEESVFANKTAVQPALAAIRPAIEALFAE